MRLAFIILFAATAVNSYSAELALRSVAPVAATPQKIPNADAYYPVVGQNKAACRKQYKDPCQLAENSDGTETWVYFFAKGKPFFPQRAPVAKLTVLRVDFDTTGRVSKWSSSQEKKW